MADPVIPSALLRSMLGDCPTWRALVDDPDLLPTEMIAAATAAAADDSLAAPAASRIVYGAFEDDANTAAPDWRDHPKGCVRPLADVNATRTGNASWDETGELAVQLEYLDGGGSFAAEAYRAECLFRSIFRELLRLPRGAGRLDLIRGVMEPFGLLDPKERRGKSVWAAEIVVWWKGC